VPVPAYHIAVFENRFPAMAGKDGRCEVVCYTDRHDASMGTLPLKTVRDLVAVWRDRMAELYRVPNVRFVFVFENRGRQIGVTLDHPHGQIYAYPFVPPLIERESRSFRAHRIATGRCIYCDLLEAEQRGPRVVARIPTSKYPPPSWGIETGNIRRRLKPRQPHRLRTGEPGWLSFVPPFARWPYEMHIAPTAHRHVEFYPVHRARDRLKYPAGSETGAGAFIRDFEPERAAADLRAA